MKKSIFSLCLIACIIPIHASADVKEVVSETTKEVVSFTKEFFKGLNEGVDEGRSQTESADGAVVVTSVEQFDALLSVEVVSVSSNPLGTTTEVEVGFKNATEKPVRIANLDDEGVVLLIDVDGYSTLPKSSNRNNAEITVPPLTEKKYTFSFASPHEKAMTLRLWSKELDLAIKPESKEEPLTEL